MVEPTVTTEEVVKWNAQLNLATIVEEFYDQIRTLQLESCPKFFYCVVSHHKTGLCFALLVYTEPLLVYYGIIGLPSSEER